MFAKRLLPNPCQTFDVGILTASIYAEFEAKRARLVNDRGRDEMHRGWWGPMPLLACPRVCRLGLDIIPVFTHARDE